MKETATALPVACGRSDIISSELKGTVIPIADYRRILKDTASSDTEIVDRLQYLESFCRSVIRIELEKHVHQNKK
jgi:hypothetical protein